MTSISDGAFFYCSSLTSLTFPASLTTLGNNAVIGCSKLTSIKFLGNAPATNGETLGEKLPSNYVTLYAPGAKGFTNPWRGYPAREEASSSESDWEYTVNSDGTTVTITKYKGTADSTVNIPSKLTVNGASKTVTQIADNALAYHNEITSLTIPSTVKAIGNKALAFCNGLTSVTIPSSVVSSNTGGTDSGEWFYDCQKLSTVTFQDGSTIIPAWSLAHMPALTTVNIPASVRTIGAYAFYGCPKLSSPQIPNGVTNIGNNAFSQTGVTTITVPSGVTKVEPGTFKDCDNLTKVNLPNTVTHIKQNAFNGCSNLATITIPEGPQVIEDGAFQNCNKLTYLVIPASITTMGDKVVEGCSALQYIEFKGDAPKYTGTAGDALTLGAGLPQGYVSKYWFGKKDFPPTGQIWREYKVQMLGGVTVTFKDWDGTVLTTQTIASGTAATAPSNPSREGYTFAGWDKPFNSVTADTTITAQYTSITYTVTFKDWDNKVLKTQTVNYKQNATAPADPVREGYTFTGWDKPFNIVTSDLTVTAQYTENIYTVIFVDYDNTVLKTQTVKHKQAATAPPNPTREGYTFRKWDTDFSTVTSNLTVTALYVQNGATLPKYTVIFKDWDGTELDKQIVEEESSAKKPTEPTRQGYTFIGWDKPFNSITQDLTITAQYKINEYTVVFKDWNGTILKAQTVEYKGAATAPENPTRTGYTFKNWDKDFSSVTENLTVTAQYTINTYTVTFKDWDDATLKTQTVNYKQAATAPANPKRSGYTFKGWDKPFKSITADTEITAQYEKKVNEFTVTFNDWNGVALSAQKVKEGGAAQAPANPTRWGYTFTGWDKPFDKITADTIITAQYTLRDARELLDEELKKLDPNDPDYWNKLKELEDKYKELYNVKVGIDVNRNTHGNFHTNSDKIDVIGAAINANPNETLSLRFSKPDNNVTINGERYKTNNAVQVNINLLNLGENMGKLTQMILIKAPVPTGLDPENFRILHYHADGSIEMIKPKLNGDGTCTFTVNSFSVFAFVEEITANQPQAPNYSEPQKPNYSKPQHPYYSKPQTPGYSESQILDYNQPQVQDNDSTPIQKANDKGSVAKQKPTAQNDEFEPAAAIGAPSESQKTQDDYPNMWYILLCLIAIPLIILLIVKLRKRYVKG